MTTSQLRRIERCRIGTEARNVCQRTGCQESLELGEVTKRRTRQRVLAVERPRQLAGLERNRHFVLCRGVERLGQIKVCAALRIEGGKKPELVLLDRSADIATKVSF